MHPLLQQAQRKTEEAYTALIERLEPDAARRLFHEAETLLLRALEEESRSAEAWRALAELYEVLGAQRRVHEAQVRYATAAGLAGAAALEYAGELIRHGGSLPLARTLLARGAARGRSRAAAGEPDDAEPLTALRRELEAAEAAAKEPPALPDAELLALKEHLHDAGLVEFEPGRLQPRNQCDGTFRLTDAWLAERGLELKAVHDFLAGRGGKCCDCEVLFNVEPLGIVDTLAHWKAFAARRAYWRGRARFEERAEEAHALMDREEFDEALELWDELAGLDPADERLLLLRGKCFQELERFEEAEGSFRRLLQVNPKHGFGYFALGALLQETERAAEAERVYRRGLEAAPETIPVYWGLAVTLLAVGRRDEAAEVARRGLARAPDEAGLRELLDACQEAG